MYGVISTICHRQIYIYGRYFTVVRGEMVVVVVVTFEGDAMHFKVLRRQTFFLLRRSRKPKPVSQLLKVTKDVRLVVFLALANWSSILHTLCVFVGRQWQCSISNGFLPSTSLFNQSARGKSLLEL